MRVSIPCTALVALFLAAASPVSSTAAELENAVLAYDTGRFTDALSGFRHLAERGEPGAEFMLGAMHFYGRGVPRDDGIAAVWFHKAAHKGHAGAQLAYGSLHIRGVGVRQDLETAYMWLTLAAEQGVPGIRQQAVLLQSDAERVMDRETVQDARQRARSWTPGRAGLWIDR
jgi:TPR repeat protein